MEESIKQCSELRDSVHKCEIQVRIAKAKLRLTNRGSKRIESVETLNGAAALRCRATALALRCTALSFALQPASEHPVPTRL
jgi:hypothetical protein